MRDDRLALVAGALVPRARRVPLAFRADPLWLFGACHAVLWLAAGYLFHQQGRGAFPADTRPHAAYALGEGDVAGSAYSLLHLVLRGLAWPARALGMADGLETYVVLMTLVLVASMVASSLMLVSYFNRYASDSPWLAGIAPLLLLLVSMLVVSGSGSELYIGIGTPNPWHNPTYVFARPFSIAVFLLALQYLADASRGEGRWQGLLAISAFAVMSMWGKPSFLMSFLPAIALYSLWKCVSSALSLKAVVLLGLALLPSLLPLLGIESTVYGGTHGEQGGVHFTRGDVWRLYSDNIPLSIVLGMAFPLYVLAIYRTRISATMALALVNFAVATLIYYFLAESGYRFSHANFSWGYLFGMFFLYFAAIEVFFFRSSPGRVAHGIGWALLAWHGASGGYYLAKLLLGGHYL